MACEITTSDNNMAVCQHHVEVEGSDGPASVGPAPGPLGGTAGTQAL